MSKGGEDDKRVGPEFERALRLRDEGQIVSAIAVLSELATRRPDLAHVAGTLAGLQFQHEDFEGAARNARRAVQLAPRSELASRILFHALYQLRDLAAAFEELARFRSTKNSLEYDQTLSELHDELLKQMQEKAYDPFLQQALSKLRQELAARPIVH